MYNTINSKDSNMHNKLIKLIESIQSDETKQIANIMISSAKFMFENVTAHDMEYTNDIDGTFSATVDITEELLTKFPNILMLFGESESTVYPYSYITISVDYYANGNGYSGDISSRDDDPGQSANFEDGIEFDLNNMILTLDADGEMPAKDCNIPDDHPLTQLLYNYMNEIMESNANFYDSIYEKLLNNIKDIY